MISPKDYFKFDFSSVSREKLFAYLFSKDWGTVFVANEGTYYLNNSKKALFSEKKQEAWFMIPREIVSLEIENGLVLPPEHFGDYGLIVWRILEDLERHENRHKAQILEDILNS